ncbi:invasion associated locus B family protein [Rhizobium sp. PL01]|uniref:invasion associated locus B family protein n=1 Tax=Rhizobium sp. PL01 TaxID=3085631 RepID=UPI00298119FA|nr:invasion associated locus B family protein [Rhizobium sp. PL01]MDW5312937.1 invasion associated locus B family protein [Rhizobium sp. PL01]
MSLNRHILAALALASTILPAQAQPVMVKTFGHWGVYSYNDNGQTNCYALTMPRTMQPAEVNHGNNFLLVAPKGAGGYMPQAQMGYGLKAESEVTIKIGGEAFAMTPRGNVAWLTRENRDNALVAAMKSGSTLTLQATSSRGTNTQYDFSLDGITAALKKATSC